jgi:hypothetical protein
VIEIFVLVLFHPLSSNLFIYFMTWRRSIMSTAALLVHSFAFGSFLLLASQHHDHRTHHDCNIYLAFAVVTRQHSTYRTLVTAAFLTSPLCNVVDRR